MTKPNPHGDDQGTRIGSPDAASPSQRNKSAGATGAGAEAAEGIHSADGSRDPSQQSAVEGAETGRGTGGSADAPRRSGSEPLKDRENEHRSGYGGAGGKPVVSSDKREADPK